MAKSVNAGKAAIELSVMDNVDKGLKSASRKLKKWGGGLMKAGAALTGGIVGLMAGPVLLASQAEEAMAKFDTVFGDNAQTMQAWSKATAAAYGSSRVEMNNMLGSMQDLLVPMGVAEGAATDMNKEFAKLSVDLASFNSGQGITTAQAFQDLTSAVSGSPETMKKYGVVLNETKLKQEALNLGLVDSIQVLNPAQKAQAAYSLIMQDTSAAQGDAIRTAGSFANQMKRLKANALDIGSAIGSGMLAPLSAAGKVINRVATNTKAWIDENPQLVKGIAIAAGAVGGLGFALLTMGGAIALAGMAMGVIASGLAFLLSPLALIIGGLAVAIAMVAKFTNFFGDALDWLGDRFGPLVGVVKDSMVAIQEAFQVGDLTKAWELIVETMEVIWLDLTNGIRSTWYDTLNYVSEITVPFVEGIGKMFQRLAEFLRSMMNKYKAYYNSVFNWVTEKIGEAGGVRTIGGPVDAFSGSGVDTFTSGLANGMEKFGANMESSAQGMHDERVARRKATMAELEARRAGLGAKLGDEAKAAKAAQEARKKLEAPDVDTGIGGMLGQFGKLMAGAGGRTGTFSAAGASLAGGPGGFQKEMVSLSKRSLDKQDEIAKNTKDNIAKVGK